ncbi:MAG: polysaccharide biosynthesis C-terminal domain-containing protein [Bacteroidetes bacterium]|nr:polysaccharide biosynthesis C-terminal domain-containing protein [Bacteroidota bacterium]
MQRRFIRNLALLLSLNLLIKPFWILGIDRAVQNSVGDGTYGFFLSIYSYSFLFYILLDLGITNYNNRNIAQNNQLLSKYFAGIAGLKMLLSLLYAAVIFGIGILIGYDGAQLKLLGWVAFNQVLLSFILYLRSNISGLLLFKVDSIFSILDRLLMILICSFLLWSGFVTGPFQIEWFVYAQTAAYIITLIAAFVFVIKHAGRILPSFQWPFMLAIIRKSLPYALLVLLMSFYNRLEPVLIERLLPAETGFVQTGIYGKAFRLLDAGNNISLLFSVLLLPMFASMIKKRESVNQLVKLSFSIIFSMSMLVAALSLAYSRELMELLYGLRDGEDLLAFNLRIEESAAVFRVLMGSFVSVSCTYIFGTLLTANGNLAILNIVAGAGVVINVGMNFILIPGFEAMGAAWSSFTVQFVTAVIQLFIARKIFNLRFGKVFYFRVAAFSILLFASAMGSVFMPFHWIINFLSALIFGFILVFVTKMIEIKSILVLITSAYGHVKK